MSPINPSRWTRRAMRYSALIALVVASGAAVVAGPGAAGAADSQSAVAATVYMAPGATNRACSRAQPCGSLKNALAVAGDGAVIVAASGEYGPQNVGLLTRGQSPKTVTVTSASGRGAVFDKTSIDQPGVTFDSVTFRTGLIMYKGPATVRNVHVIDGTLLVRADNVTITDSLVEGGYGRDGINIAGSPGIVKNVTVRRTTVRDIGAHTKDRPQHPDCIQIFDAQHVTIEQNNLYNCFGSGLIFSPGARKGISDVLVRANFIQGCITARNPHCSSGASMDLRTIEAKNITITQNTFGSGAVRLPYNPTITATRNIVGYLSVSRPCTTSLSDSLIASYPTYACKNGAPGKTVGSTSGNTVGSVRFDDQADGDLHVAGNLTAARKSGLATLAAAEDTDIDGQRFDGATIGADQPGGAPSALMRVNPKVTMRTVAARAAKAGWYSSPVRLTYDCKAGSAHLVSGCPSSVRVTRQGATVVAGGTVIAADGGRATAPATTVRIDTVAPKSRVYGLRTTKNLRSAPRLRCRASDSASGAASCKITAHRRGKTVVYRLVATDRAGNVAQRRFAVTLRVR